MNVPDETVHMTRRAALGAIGGFVAAGSLDSARWVLVPGDHPPIERLGVQLYTVRSEMEKSVERTLARVSQIGYREVEFAGYFDQPPSRIATILTQHNLTAPSVHVGADVLRATPARVFDIAEELGHRYVTVPSLDNQERTPDGYRRLAEEFNRWGEAAAKRRMTFAFHNHEYEFLPVGDTTGYDILLSRTDPALVKFQIDLFWMTKAGKQPIDYLRRDPARFPMVHVKDMASDGSMVDVGAGRLDFRSIFEAGTAIRHFFVEHDDPRDPFASITVSARYLRAMK
jgi:sugar phosphate isomerase/epimerase